jgi:phasin family protein
MMTLLTPEQIGAAQKANLDTLFGLVNKAFDGFQKLVQLNLQVVKSTIAESQDNTQKALSVKDPQELLALQASLAQPFAEKVLSYGRHVYEIASATQAEYAKVAEAQYEAHTRRAQTLVDNLVKSAPTGSEAAVAVIQSAITAANTAYETIHKATQQAVDIAESNFDTAATAASKAAREGIEQASRATRK